MITFYKDIAYKLELVVLDDVGKFAPGLTITYEIRKCLDNSLFASGTMSEISSVYYTDVTFTVSAEYRVKYTTPAGYENGFDEILVEDLPASDVLVKRVLGLSQENYRLFDIVYTNSLITSTTIKTYPTASDCEADTNSLAEYSVVATYDIDGKLLTYKSKKV
jgi:hypothetical protein